MEQQTVIKHKLVLPKIPLSWILVILVIGLVVMRFYSIDSWTTATLGTLIGAVLMKEFYNNKPSVQPPQVPVISP